MTDRKSVLQKLCTEDRVTELLKFYAISNIPENDNICLKPPLRVEMKSEKR